MMKVENVLEFQKRCVGFKKENMKVYQEYYHVPMIGRRKKRAKMYKGNKKMYARRKSFIIYFFCKKRGHKAF
jgi:hypothetical protein